MAIVALICRCGGAKTEKLARLPPSKSFTSRVRTRLYVALDHNHCCSLAARGSTRFYDSRIVVRITRPDESRRPDLTSLHSGLSCHSLCQTPVDQSVHRSSVRTVVLCWLFQLTIVGTQVRFSARDSSVSGSLDYLDSVTLCCL